MAIEDVSQLLVVVRNWCIERGIIKVDSVEIVGWYAQNNNNYELKCSKTLDEGFAGDNVGILLHEVLHAKILNAEWY
jgi:translation elongation factor EF-Tu-like GTPase